METSWLENLLKAGADAYSTVKTADALKHQQNNSDGMQYIQGQFSQGQAGGAIPTGWLLIGGAVLLFVMMKD